MIVTKWFDKRLNIAQTIWSGLQYSLLSDDNKQCHPFVYCKEFVLDAFWATLYNKPITLYGFLYHPERDSPTSLIQVRMLLRNTIDPIFAEHVPKCLKFINRLEDEFGFPRTTMEVCENADRNPTFLFVSPGNWLHAPPLLSLLTLMVRIGMIYNGRENIWKHVERVADGRVVPYQRRDNEHLHRSYECIRDLIETKCARFHTERIENWPIPKGRWSAVEIHENGGIVSLASGSARWVCPGWYPPKPEQPIALDGSH